MILGELHLIILGDLTSILSVANMYKTVVDRKELGTEGNPAALKDTPTSSNEGVIGLLSHITSIAIPCSTARLSFQIRSPQFSATGNWKVQMILSFDVPGSRAMTTDK